jgi:hypothetical protein
MYDLATDRRHLSRDELIACTGTFATDSLKRREFWVKKSSLRARACSLEILDIATGEAEIVGRRPVTLCEAR